MSLPLIDRSPDLKQLRDEGYDVDIVEGYVLVRDVPYVTSSREIKRGILISTLTLANNVTAPPDTHVAMLAGEYPCHSDGSPIEAHSPGSHKHPDWIDSRKSLLFGEANAERSLRELL